MDAGAVAVVGLVNPVVGTLLGVVLLAEAFGPVHLAAVAVVVGSVLLAQQPARSRVTGILTGTRTGIRTRGAGRLGAGPRRRPQPTPRHTVGSCPT
jgi:probable blue pigment (indigoidine) exporter